MDNTNIDNDVAIALVAAIMNFILSLIIPPFLKNTKLPIVTQIKQNYESNRNILFISCCIVFIFVYVSLKITPWVQENIFTVIGRLSNSNKIILSSPTSSQMESFPRMDSSSRMNSLIVPSRPINAPNDYSSIRYKYFNL